MPNYKAALGSTILICAMVSSMIAVRGEGLIITGKQLHVDVFEDPGIAVPWSEGWGEEEQFYPRYFQPAGSLHLFLRNAGTREIAITDLLFNGKRIAESCTRPDFAGPVIWYRANPERISPGATAMVLVRLRKPMSEKVMLGVKYDGDKVVETEISQSDAPKLRIASAAFDLKQNKIFGYVEKLCDDAARVGRVLLDGRELSSQCIVLLNRDFESGCAAYLEITPLQSLKYGEFVVLTVETVDGNAVSYQLRIRDDRFILALIYGAPTRYLMYQKNLFNTIYNLGSPSSRIADDFWIGMPETPGLSLIQTASRDEDVLRVVRNASPERFTFNTIDESDANDWWYTKLALKDRCGTGIMAHVEPMLHRVRNHAPTYLTTQVLNSTFAPANFYIYGEVTDVASKDIYPLYTHGESSSLADIPPSVTAVVNGAAPRPANIVLWGIMATVDNFRRANVPFENDAEVHYAIGAGARGITYFMDTAGAVKSSGGEYYLGATHIKPLWQSMGKLNAKLTRLAPLLNRGHRAKVVSSSNPEQLWVSALQSGADSLVVIVVNRNYIVRSNDRMKFPHVFPVRDERINVRLPDWLKGTNLRVFEVRWDRVEPLRVREADGSMAIAVKEMTESKVFVISKAPDMEQVLAVDQSKLDEMQKSWAAPAPREGTRVQTPIVSGKPIPLSADDVSKGQLVISFANPDNLRKAASIDIAGAELDQLPAGLALFPTGEPEGSRFELTYDFESPVPLKNLTVSLLGTTPNFAYGANNAVGISSSEHAPNAAGCEFVYDKSYKVDWDGGASGRRLEKTLGTSANRFLVKVVMADPRISSLGEYSNIINDLRITWQLEK